MKGLKMYGCLSVLVVLCMVIILFAGVAFSAEDDDQLIRLAGQDRYETAAIIALHAYEQVDTVIIARGDVLFDALSGSVLAGALDAPILLTVPGALPDKTAEAIDLLGATNAIILGGEAAVAPAVSEALEEAGLHVARIAGQDRFETAADIAREVAAVLGENFGDQAFIVSGTAVPDALTIGSYAAASGEPILLVQLDAVHAATTAVMDELGITATTIIGGPAVVSDNVEDILEANRVFGANRFMTSVEVAKEYFDMPQTVIFASGRDANLVDAMAGSYLGALLDAPILYCGSPYQEAIQYFSTVATTNTRAYILGGEIAVSEECELLIYQAMQPDPSP